MNWPFTLTPLRGQIERDKQRRLMKTAEKLIDAALSQMIVHGHHISAKTRLDLQQEMSLWLKEVRAR